MTDSLRESLTAAMDAVESEPSNVDSAVQPESVSADSLTQPETTTTERARDESGRFVAKEKPAEATSEPQAEVSPPIERKPRPKSWRKEYDADWERLDPRLADYLSEREEQYTNGVTTYKQEWERVKPLADVFAPYAQKLQQYGARAEQVIPGLLNAHLTLVEGSPQQRQELIYRLARDYGVQLGDGQQQATPQQDAQSQWLMQQLQQTQAGVQSLQQQWQQTQEAQTLEQINRFASNTEKYPLFEEAKPIMADLLEKGMADSLDAAYSKAIRLSDDLWRKEQERHRSDSAARQAADKQAAAAKAKAAAVSPKTASPTGVVAKAPDGNLRSALEGAFNDAIAGRI